MAVQRGGRFGQDTKNFRINVLICLSKLLKQNHHPTNLSYPLSSSGAKIRVNWKFCLPTSKGSRIPLVRAEYYGQVAQFRGRRITAGSPKSPNNHTQVGYFNTAHLLPKHLRLETGGFKLASCCRTPVNLVTSLAVIQYSSALSMYMEWGGAQ